MTPARRTRRVHGDGIGKPVMKTLMQRPPERWTVENAATEQAWEDPEERGQACFHRIDVALFIERHEGLIQSLLIMSMSPRQFLNLSANVVQCRQSLLLLPCL